MANAQIDRYAAVGYNSEQWNLQKFPASKKEQGKTVFLTTHNLEEAENICDHLDIIEAGRILCQGTPSEIRKSVTKEDRYILKVRYLKTEILKK